MPAPAQAKANHQCPHQDSLKVHMGSEHIEKKMYEKVCSREQNHLEELHFLVKDYGVMGKMAIFGNFLCLLLRSMW